jgi:branched-chain amino acid transport system substrate-binding protein
MSLLKATDANRRRSSAAREIGIGVAIDLGPHRDELLEAISYAVEAHTDRSRVFRVVSEDDGRDASIAPVAAMRLLDAGVAFVIGHFSASAALAAAPLYERAGVPFFAPGTTHPDLTACGYRFVFRVCGRDGEQAALLAAVIEGLTQQSKARPFVISQSTPYGRSMGKLLCQELTARGVKVHHHGGAVDDVRAAAAISDAAIAIAGAHDFIATVAASLRGLGHRGPLVASDDAYSARLLSLGGEAVDGMRVAVLESADRAGADAPARRFEKERGRRPGAYFLTSYIAATMLVGASTLCGSVDGKAMAASIRSRSWRTPLGVFSFDDNGDVRGLRWSTKRVAHGQFIHDTA